MADVLHSSTRGEYSHISKTSNGLRLIWAWIPAVTIGARFKWNDGHNDINRQTGGLCEMLGVDHDSGTEITAVATKTISDWLPKPLIVSTGLREVMPI